MVKQMAPVSNKSGWIGLSNTEVTLLDSIIDPFGTATDQQSFLNVEEFYQSDFKQKDDGIVHTIFRLHGKNMIQQRIRYGVWQTLGDVGGFYDGIGLMIGSVISQFAASKFLLELFTGIKVDQSNQSNQQRKKHKAFVRAIKHSEPGVLTNQTNFDMLLHSMKNLKSLKVNLKLGAANFCCRLLRKHKGQQLIQKI